MSKEDIVTVLSYMPVTKTTQVDGEGIFTQEGGGAQDFRERLESMQEMYKTLDTCFGDKALINAKEFQ